jgi:hypothetical protein
MSLFDGADIIFSYTRAEAINDGVLVDVTETAREAGFKIPVALSAGLWADAVAWDEANGALQDEAGRLWDVIWMSYLRVHAGGKGRSRVEVEVLRIPNLPDAREATVLQFLMDVGPGDEGEPVITLMRPEDD